MKLYEIDSELRRLVDSLEFDAETGELCGDSETLLKQIQSLQMEKRSVLEYLAKVVLNLRSEASALKEEESRLKARRERLSKKETRLLDILDRECAGQKTDLGIATFSYRKTSRVDISDELGALRWLKENDHTDCIRIPPPEISKSEVKKLLSNGAEVPGCAIVDDYSYSLK